MEHLNENNEEALRKLMKDVGLLSAPADFTHRVMSQVGCIAGVTESTYKPLIGIKGWTIILASLLLILASCIMILASGDYTSYGFFDFLTPVFGFLQNLEISFKISMGSVYIGIVIFISILILLSVDFVSIRQ
ncbi:MAG: hypothetical protein JXA61_04115 [Bacteroidales bacterium]|nr:hypothetical protein [Bacteroidales bacterium]